MIAEICFTADWLDKKRKELKGVDPSLLERALHAFALLGHLAKSDLKFIFKGGTSLLLHGGHYAFGYLANRYGLTYRPAQAVMRTHKVFVCCKLLKLRYNQIA